MKNSLHNDIKNSIQNDIENISLNDLEQTNQITSSKLQVTRKVKIGNLKVPSVKQRVRSCKFKVQREIRTTKP